MLDRETILPLTLGAVLAMLVHLVLVPSAAQSLLSRATDAKALPDLAVESFELVGSPAPPGEPVALSAVIKNKGDASAALFDEDGNPVIAHRFYLSADRYHSDDDVELKPLSAPPRTIDDLNSDANTLGPDAAYRFDHLLVDLPDDATGPMFILLVIDADNAVEESDERNNIAAAAVEIMTGRDETAQPDLTVKTLTAPDRATAGEPIDLSFHIANIGDRAAFGRWDDGVFLSADDELSPDDALIAVSVRQTPLPRGSAYEVATTAYLSSPVRQPTRMFLIAAADRADHIIESDESNNTLVRPIEVLPAPPTARERTGDRKPDIEMLHVRAPSHALNGEHIEIEYLVANRGGPMQRPEDARSSTFWKDRLWLSADKKIDEEDTELAAIDGVGRLDAGAHYPGHVTTVVRVPEDFRGRLFLIAKADADEQIDESREDNNIKVVPIDIDKLDLGKADAQPRTTVAWIPYEDFRKLVAAETETLQPAVQAKVDPLADAPLPLDPSPPTPPAPQPQPQLTKQPVDTPANATTAPPQRIKVDRAEVPAEQIESVSPDLVKARPITQPRAESIVTLPDVAPRPLLPAEGPVQPGDVVTQPEADAPRATVGEPATQIEQRLPMPIEPVTSPLAIARAPSIDDASQDAARADAPSLARQPTKQQRASSPLDQLGTPSQKIPAVAPPDPDGQPTRQTESDTPKPDTTGQPANLEPIAGNKLPDPQLAIAGRQPGAKPKKSDDDTEQPRRPVTQPRPANPTAAPRDDSTVPPTVLKRDEVRINPGGVLTGPGIQITAAVPDISTTSWLVSGPTAANPKARLTFDKTGKVVLVQIIRSTGHANLDSPIKAAFYRFKAKGKALEEVERTFDIEITLLLKKRGTENDKDDEDANEES